MLGRSDPVEAHRQAMSETQIFVLALSLNGLLFVALGYAMPHMQLNRLAGIRIQATLADERVWRDTHVRAAPRFRLAGWLTFGSGLVLSALPVPDWFALATFTAVSVGSLAWFIADSARYASARLRHYRAIDEAVASRD